MTSPLTCAAIDELAVDLQVEWATWHNDAPAFCRYTFFPWMVINSSPTSIRPESYDGLLQVFDTGVRVASPDPRPLSADPVLRV